MAEETQSLEVSDGKGRGLKITGRDAFLMFVVIVETVGLAYLLNFNLNSWGEPIPMKNAFMEQAAKLELHADVMSYQHSTLTRAMRMNTYVQWACSPMNTSPDAKRKCSEVDLIKPEMEDQKLTRRRFRLQGDDEQ